MTQEGANNPPCTILRCTFPGGFTGEQLVRYPCKLRRHICARCGMHRGEHISVVPNAGVVDRDHLLPPRKRSPFRRPGGEFQPPPGLAGGGEKKREAQVVEEEGGAASAAVLPEEDEEGQSWTGSAIAKGKRAPRRKRADLLLLCCEISSLNE
ncbi:hypothetical protein HU200_017227 [Digitaria exilis]|uniref:Uncharacterized protein n=1 Tax=Digitaria exilis TaxID=1010633 RepID=A0A835KI51_9POAL|nr:hypothetical protein HU200_017227 [Digitaria exilis]